MLGPVGVAKTHTLGTMVRIVPGAVHGVVRKAYSTASPASTSTVIRRSFRKPIRVMIGESISAMNRVPTREITGRWDSGVTHAEIAAVTRPVVCGLVRSATARRFRRTFSRKRRP